MATYLQLRRSAFFPLCCPMLPMLPMLFLVLPSNLNRLAIENSLKLANFIILKASGIILT